MLMQVQLSQTLATQYHKQHKHLYRLQHQLLPDFQHLYVQAKTYEAKDPGEQLQTLQQGEPPVGIESDPLADLSDFYVTELRQLQAYLAGLAYVKHLETQRAKLEQKLALGKTPDDVA